MELILHTFRLKLRHDFKISRGTRKYQNTVIAELRDKNYSGYGEAAVNAYYGVNTEEVLADLMRLKPFVETQNWRNPAELWHKAAQQSENSFALCALDMAAWDLFAKQRGVPLYQLWGLSADNLPKTNYTIGLADLSEMKERIRETPWPIYKIKLGTKDDPAIVRALRQETSSLFRVDANGAWTAAQTIDFSKEFLSLGVEFIEQPLPATKTNAMKSVFAASALPLVADESCVKEQDVYRCLGKFHGINIKLTKCGGLTPALRMIAQAKQLKLKVMVGCMTESSVGISAIAQLLPLLDYVDMDGALLFENDIAEGIQICAGKISYAPQNGTGAKLICRNPVG